MSSKILDKIIQAKENIDDDIAIEKVVSYLKLENYNPNSKSASCPFGHPDSTPSFKWDKKLKCFHCFSCGKNFSLLDLYIRTEGSYKKAVEKLCQEAGIPFNKKDLVTEDRKEMLLNYNYPEEIDCKNRTVVENYCAKRGISINTLDYMGIKQDYYGNVVFELRDIDDTLLALKYRLSRAVKNKEESKMWWDKRYSNCPILYNINRIDTSQPLIIVEGYFDALAVVESGNTNVVSIPGGAQDLKWIQFNFDFLESFDTIYLWFDNDRAGNDGLEKVINRLGESRIRVIKPTEEDEDRVEEYYKKAGSEDLSIRKTDANNILLACGSNRISELITFAEEIPCKNLKYLMDCEVSNIMDIPKTSTGLGSLDEILYGNLYPCFTIYSGIAGAGKSTLTNAACVISALENNKKIFMFSGELGEGQLLDWIITPYAGLNHILEMENKSTNKPFYVVTTEATAAIKKFYKKNIILYDSTNSLDTSGESILKEMETAYRRFGCTVFLIDNLMCISFEGEESESKWDSQKKFITKLMGFTNKYGVNVNLVLHPRKPSQAQQSGVQSFSVYDLHGASEIGNLCHRLLWVSRLNDQEKQLRIDVIKDRPSQSAGQHCELYYDKRTRRIYGTEEERTRTYKWEQSSNIIYTQKQKELLLCNRPDDRKITDGIQMAIDNNQM